MASLREKPTGLLTRINVDFLKIVLPGVLTFITGGTLFTFVLALLNRRDTRSDKDDADALIISKRGRVYEVAYRHSETWARHLAQLAIASVSAHHDGKDTLAFEFIRLLGEFLGEDNEAGKWRQKPFPDFMEEARKEIEIVEGEEA
jgi:hypothetical protein